MHKRLRFGSRPVENFARVNPRADDHIVQDHHAADEQAGEKRVFLIVGFFVGECGSVAESADPLFERFGIDDRAIERDVRLPLNETCLRVHHALCAFELFADQPRARGAPHPAQAESDILHIFTGCDLRRWLRRGISQQRRHFPA
jgi:hypothetical protein